MAEWHSETRDTEENARQIANAGLIVYVGSRDVARGQRAVDEIGGDARLFQIDVTGSASIAAAAARVQQLDILVNNAGIMVDGKPAIEADVDSFRRTYETSAFGAGKDQESEKYILFDHDGVLVDTEFWYYKLENAPWRTLV